MKVGERIKKYLTEHGIRQNYVSKEIGLENNKFNMSMNGTRRITLEEYVKICGVLAVPLNTFLDDGESLSDVESEEETS